MSNLEQHFDDAAENYDELINKTLINYGEMVEALVNAIPDSKRPRILDLGCGTGNIAKKALERFPEAQVTCLDMSSRMMELAKEKLSGYNNIEYVLGDFTTIDMADKYDAVISSLALHHIKTDEGKKQMYKRIYGALNENGVFYNADVIKPNSPYNELLNERMSDKYMKEHGLSDGAIAGHKQKRKDNDLPVTLVRHLELLGEAGFKQLDVIWKHYSNAVYGGTKL